jgi:4-coumarate--CoA ligase
MLKTAIAAAAKSSFPKNRIFQFSDDEDTAFTGIKDWRTIMGSVEEGERYAWTKFTPEQSLNTIATINYSSGTTGLPKGVCVSHYNLIANVEQGIFMKYLHKPFDFKNRPVERWIGFLPLYHAYGQLYTIIMAAKLQIPVFIMKQFIYGDFLASIQKFKITHLQVAPPILVMLNKRSETTTYDISSVTDILCGAAPLSKELQNDVSTRFHVQINQGWGMTELTCGAIQVPGGINDRTGSVGQLDPNCECKLLDDDGREVGVGQPGELYIRGPNVCLRYWNNEVATKQSISPDNWLRTGDIAVYDEKGYFWIVDRKKV